MDGIDTRKGFRRGQQDEVQDAFLLPPHDWLGLVSFSMSRLTCIAYLLTPSFSNRLFLPFLSFVTLFPERAGTQARHDFVCTLFSFPSVMIKRRVDPLRRSSGQVDESSPLQCCCCWCSQDPVAGHAWVLQGLYLRTYIMPTWVHTWVGR